MHAFLDDDVEPIALRRGVIAAGILEDELVAYPLPDPARDRIDVDGRHHLGELGASRRGPAVERLEAAAGERRRAGAKRERNGKPTPPH